MRRLPRGSVGGVVLLWAGSVQADVGRPAGIEWSWLEEPDLVDCPDEDRVRERLEQKLEGAHQDEAADAPKVSVELRRIGDGHEARLLVERRGEPPEVRELWTAAACADLEDAMVLSLALLLANGDSSAPSPRPAVPAGGGLLPESVRPIEHGTAPSEYEESPREDGEPDGEESQQGWRAHGASRAWLGIGAVVSHGQLPGPGFGGMLRAGVPLYGFLSLSVGAGYQGIRDAEQGEARFAFSLTEAWLGATASVLSWSRGGMELEGALLGGWLHAVPRSPEPLDPGDSAFGGVRVHVAARQELTRRIDVSLGFGSHFLANTWRFHVQERDEPVWSQPRAALRAEIVLIWKAP